MITKEQGLQAIQEYLTENEIVEHTQKTGESVNVFMIRAVKETMARDKEKNQ